jgi:hydroxypyruvate reductase
LRGHAEADLAGLYELILRSGLDIQRMNIVRRRFSRWGAGRLALALAPAATWCLAISDAIGDDPSVIGSGPCSPDRSTVSDVLRVLGESDLLRHLSVTHRDHLTSISRGNTPETLKPHHPAFAHISTRVIASNALALSGAAAAARSMGLDAEVVPEPLAGEAAVAGERIARELLHRARNGAPGCVVWGGETTVALDALSRRAGGGRCQELALAASRILASAGEAAGNVSILAAGTDGRDGTTEAAGAVVDASSWQRIIDGGMDPGRALGAHESNAALDLAGALIPRRVTGTNVMDVVLATIH